MMLFELPLLDSDLDDCVVRTVMIILVGGLCPSTCMTLSLLSISLPL